MSNKLIAFSAFVEHNKYWIVIVLGVLFVGFADENSMLQNVRYHIQIDDLKKQINEYEARNKADTKLLRELKSNPGVIEKIARERYFMKTADEDIFVLSDDERSNTNNE